MRTNRNDRTDAAGAVQGHWLINVVTRQELAPPGALHFSPGDDLEACWTAAARASGISQDELAVHVATYFGLAAASLAAADPRTLRLLPERLMRRHHVFPLRENERELVVAVADPTDLSIEEDVAFSSDRRPVLEIAPPVAILEAIRSLMAPSDSIAMDVGGGTAGDVKLLEAASVEVVDAQEAEFAPVIKLTNLMLQSAVERRASDVHVESVGSEGLVRFRVDGVLHNYMRMPLPALHRVLSRIKIMGKLDIADRLHPQDGRASISVGGNVCDLRISTVPTRSAEKAVIRLLPQGTAPKLPDLGLPADQLLAIRALISNRNGIVLVTGPTGSGKTTTLYAAIRELSNGEQNIMTVEDPIEYDLPGITQVQVETKQGLTFASALRSLLRQDPDVILLGEIRDLETAEVAVQASMTGHLVLATLHTNDAPAAIQRLLDLGLDRASIAATLRGVLSQRLVRCVCPECAQPVGGAPNAGERRLAELSGADPVVRAVGCQSCTKSGYRGRVPVVEVLTMTPPLTALVSHGATLDELQRAAREAGLVTLNESALTRANAGVTTLEEIERVIGFPTMSRQSAEATAPAALAVAPPPPEASTSLAADAVRAALPAPAAAPVAAAKPLILMVDDDAVNRKVARLSLEKSAFRMEESVDGVEAVERLKREPAPDLVILDLQMPRMGGVEVLDWMRKTPATASIPVIVFTAMGADNEAELMDAGADDYIRKPLDPTRFISRIKAALRRRTY
jgi:type II secretory ATPase GspE/PulE/Tfp pilus assembly ATPase PilB-like protein/ActR/RegA family two-component response regulator